MPYTAALYQTACVADSHGASRVVRGLAALQDSQPGGSGMDLEPAQLEAAMHLAQSVHNEGRVHREGFCLPASIDVFAPIGHAATSHQLRPVHISAAVTSAISAIHAPPTTFQLAGRSGTCATAHGVRFASALAPLSHNSSASTSVQAPPCSSDDAGSSSSSRNQLSDKEGDTARQVQQVVVAVAEVVLGRLTERQRRGDDVGQSTFLYLGMDSLSAMELSEQIAFGLHRFPATQFGQIGVMMPTRVMAQIAWVM